MTTVNCCWNCANCIKVAYGTVFVCKVHECEVEPCNHCEQWKDREGFTQWRKA